MGSLYDNINFEERQEIVLLKAFTAWVKLRFAKPLGIPIDKKDMETVTQMQQVDNMQKAGMISDDDAWILEKNSLLFSVTARSFLHEVLPKELFAQYGEVRFGSNRKGSVADIALFPVSLGPQVTTEVVPCTMYIVKKKELVKRFKEVNAFSSEKHVDVVPLLKSFATKFLTKADHKTIEEYYHKYKVDPDVIKAKAVKEEQKTVEDKNLKSVLNAISVQGNRTSMVKLAVTMYTIIKGAYRAVPHNVTKIKFEESGSTAVPNFSRLFYIDYDVDLEQVKSILEPILDADLKIKLGNNRVLFTTISGLDPDDDAAMENVVSAKIFNEKGLNHIFETQVGPMASVDDVNRILDKYLNQKYSR